MEKFTDEEKEKRIIHFAGILMMIWGIAVSFLVPQWQVPDEQDHVAMICNSVDFGIAAWFLYMDMDMDFERIIRQPDEKVDIEVWKSAATKGLRDDGGHNLIYGMHLSAIKHFPALLGMEVAEFLLLPTFWILAFGEIFALIFYVIICMAALRLMPVRKELLLMVMLLPMSIHQAASLSYDAVLLPVSFLFIAYVFRLAYTDVKVGWKQIAVVGLLLFVIAYIKMPYILLGLLLFMIPTEKLRISIGKYRIDGSKLIQYRWAILVVLVIGLLAGIIIFRDNYWVNVIWLDITHPLHAMEVYARSVWIAGKEWLQEVVGVFGWLDSTVPTWFCVITYVMLLWISLRADDSGRQLKQVTTTRHNIGIWFVFVVLCILIMTSMINHTIRTLRFGSEWTGEYYDLKEEFFNLTYIGGIQGRYFLPFLVLPFLTMRSMIERRTGKIREKRMMVWLNGRKWSNMELVLMYGVLAMVVTIYVLLKRYWIV